MKTHQANLIPIIAAAVSLSVSTAAHGGSYTFKTLKVPGAFTHATRAYSVNSKGQVVGQFSDSAGLHGFVWQKGTYATVDVAGVSTGLVAVNDKGVAVGFYDMSITGGVRFLAYTYDIATGQQTLLPGNSKYEIAPTAINTSGKATGVARAVIVRKPTYGFVATSSRLTLVKVPGARFTYAQGINDAGTIDGYYFGSDSLWHGFTYQSGTYATLDVAGANFTNSLFITNTGIVGGEYTKATEPEGFVHGYTSASGVVNSYDFPGTTANSVYGVANSGAVIGQFIDGSSGHVFVFAGGTYHQIDAPGATATYVGAAVASFDTSAVAPTGSFTGLFVDSKGHNNAFVALCAANQAPCTQ